MAKIVLGMGTSHGPQLSTTPEQWTLRVAADRQNIHWFRGAQYKFDELARLRHNEGVAGQAVPTVMRDKHAKCQAALDKLTAAYEKAKPDVAIIVGNDQDEVFTDANRPAFTVFWGEAVESIPKTPEEQAKMPPGIAPAEHGHCPPVRTAHTCLPALGDHIIRSLMAESFDVAQSRHLPTGPRGSNSVPHAYGFIYRRIMRDKAIPHVPVVVNTHYPPNRPSAKRCYDFGRALARAITSWQSDATVAVIASGGLTHYAIDEELDRKVLDAMQRGDAATVTGIDEVMFESGGTAETKCWIPVFGAMQETGFKMNLVDYVPCYRSEAGTGTAMAFAHWNA